MSSDATNLLFLPGLLCDQAVWEEMQRYFPSQRCYVPGYGNADSIAEMAERVLKSAPREFVLIGHSMGGRVAVEICRQAPQRVQRLVLMDTGYRPRAAGEAGQVEERNRLALLEQAQAEGMRAMGMTWAQGMVHPQRLKDSELMTAILDMIERKTSAIFAAQIRALLNRPDATPALQTIDRPTLILCGRQDTWSPLIQHEELSQLVTGSQMAVIEDAGHMAPMERPEAVAKAILDWLETA